ncbi:MAG TPA: cytochrome b/b6 domain-containing protein [Burkholderiales bacterium]|nr:cytochrome b/b6 domain-containing protein [Burkholderiales bacterium]
MKVWDRFVRSAHWSLAGCVLAAWITAELKLKWAEPLHEWLGYAALAVIALRFAWGWIGPRHARFRQFVAGPARTLAYAKAVLRGDEPRYLGHNPLGGWMIVALLSTAAAASLSGWLSVTDRFWGVEWVQETHEVLGNAVIALAALHLAGVVYTSWRQRENLAAAMLSGVKRPPEPGDVS